MESGTSPGSPGLAEDTWPVHTPPVWGSRSRERGRPQSLWGEKWLPAPRGFPTAALWAHHSPLGNSSSLCFTEEETKDLPNTVKLRSKFRFDQVPGATSSL